MSALLGGVRALSEGQRINSAGRGYVGAPRVSRDAPGQADPPEQLALSGKVSLCCLPVVPKAAGSATDVLVLRATNGRVQRSDQQGLLDGELIAGVPTLVERKRQFAERTEHAQPWRVVLHCCITSFGDSIQIWMN